MSAYVHDDTEEAHLAIWYFSVYTARRVAVFINTQDFPLLPLPPQIRPPHAWFSRPVIVHGRTCM
jgi:hypothetical protein